MCGITGFLDTSCSIGIEQMLAVVGRMASTLSHRGPDDSGVWAEAQAGIALGHRRLSIVDLSPEGHQPMLSADGRYVIVFNGEVYNFQALRRDLDAAGAAPCWRGHSDTEVMLAAIAHWGLEAAVQRFNGMFAFVLWDRCDRTLHLVRDRLGKKPLYYGWMGDTFLFGSELKALIAHSSFCARVDRGALALYLRHNYVPAPYSIYEGVRKLPPASLLALRSPEPGVLPEPVPYWRAREIAESSALEHLPDSEADLVAKLDVLLRDAVGLRMVADVPLGAFLSGGIDSSAVVALMQAQSERPVKTFTIGFLEASYNEAEDAKLVARHLGTEHTELCVTPEEARAVIPELPTLYDEPFSDSSQVPTFLVSRMARRHVTVSLSGDGGDELFGGYNRYFWGRDIWRTVGRMPRRARRMVASALTMLSPGRWQAAFEKLDGVLPARARQRNPGDKLHKLAEILPAESPEALYTALVSHWKQPSAVVRGAREPATLLTDPAERPHMKDFSQVMMYLDAVTYLPDDILAKVDRASMGVSLEARAPLLDYRVVEFAWRLPLRVKLRNGQGKWLLRQLLYRYVPPELVERPKMGFGIPLDEWLRGPLRDWAEDLLDEHRLKRDGHFDPAPIRTKWAEHLSGARSWQYLLWDVLVFQAWFDRWRPAN